VADGAAAKDGVLGRGGRVTHADGCVQLALEKFVVRRAGQHFEQPSGHDHPAVRVADVFVRLEENSAVLSEPVEEDPQGRGTVGVGEEQVRIDPVRVCQEMRTRIFSAAAGVVR
jgi:hypothetical protein